MNALISSHQRNLLDLVFSGDTSNRLVPLVFFLKVNEINIGFLREKRLKSINSNVKCETYCICNWFNRMKFNLLIANNIEPYMTPDKYMDKVVNAEFNAKSQCNSVAIAFFFSFLVFIFPPPPIFSQNILSFFFWVND